MEGWNGGRGSSWSSNFSSSSGTIVSNASSGSRLSTLSMEEAAMHFDSVRIHGDSKTWGWKAAEKDQTRQHEGSIFSGSGHLIRSLVLEFFCAPANCSIKRGNMRAVERWLKKLGVDWLFSVEDGASAGEDDLDMRISCWIRALDQITHMLCFRSLFFPDSDCGSMGLPCNCKEEGEPVAEKRTLFQINTICEEGEPVAENSVPDQYHLALFIQETMLKILTFVDVVVAWDPDTIEYSSMGQVMNTKLVDLLVVHDALSEASNKIVTLFDSPTSVQVGRIQNEMVILLSAYKSKTSEVIRSTMEKIRKISMEDGHDSPSPLHPQGSSDIHKVTRSVMAYIEFLNNRRRLVNQVMQGHVPCTENIQPVDNMIVEMMSSLQEKLVNISESFSDQGLKLLFLLNNSDQIQWSPELYALQGPEFLAVDLEHKIEGYMERYLQVSWAPLLSCLCNSTPLCLAKNYSQLSKFESEFQKICTTQMEWKVPDPGLRRKLRQAISDKIIPGYTEYIEDKKITHPKISPQGLKAKLQELFEG